MAQDSTQRPVSSAWVTSLPAQTRLPRALPRVKSPSLWFQVHHHGWFSFLPTRETTFFSERSGWRRKASWT